MDSYSYHITKWDPQPIVGGSWARVHPDPLNYNSTQPEVGFWTMLSLSHNPFMAMAQSDVSLTVRLGELKKKKKRS
jgi:hypothetical protein